MTAGAEKKIKAAAKTRFPDEILAILLGEKDEDGGYFVEDLYFPPGQEAVGTPATTGWDASWYAEARDYAHAAGLEVLGDAHSHCYDEPGADTSPSEDDWDRCETVKRLTSTKDFIFAICSVVKTRRGLQARVRFWPRIPKVELTVV